MAVPLSYSWRNLKTRRLTTALTAGGMALVVFVFTATLMLAEFDMETRFALRAARGAQQQARGLELLRKAAEPH